MDLGYSVGHRPPGRFTALIYADPGVGKTHLISTTPVNTVVISFDLTGAETLEKNVLVEDLNSRGVDLRVMEARDDREGLQALQLVKNEIEGAIKKGQPLPFQMIVLDGLCALEDSIQRDLITAGGPYVQNGRPEILSQGGWGALGARHLRVRQAALSIPRVHILFTALERARGDEDTKVTVLDASLSGQQGRRYKADVSNVLHLEAANTPSGLKTYLVFERSPRLATKARRDDLLGVGRIEADLGLIMERMGYIGSNGVPVPGGDAGTGLPVEYPPGEAPEKPVLKLGGRA